MRRSIITVLCIVAVPIMIIAAGRQYVPDKKYVTEVSIEIADQHLDFKQAADIDVFWKFTQNGRPFILPPASTSLVHFSWAPTNGAWTAVITGEVNNASQGEVYIPILASEISTNGLFDYDLTVQIISNGPTIALAAGTLNLDSRLGAP